MSDNKDTGKHTSNNNVHPLLFNAEHYSLVAPIMRVSEAIDGEARIIVNEKNGVSFQIKIHGSQVPYINEGDQIIVLVNDQCLVVSDRIRQKGESPYPPIKVEADGSYLLDAPVGVKLKSPYGTIELTSEGIKIETPKSIIDVSADGNILINGENIAFDTEDRQ